MAKYRVLDMHIRHGVGDKVREFAPGDTMDLSPEEAALIGKFIEPISLEEADGAPATVQETLLKIAAAETVEAVKALIGESPGKKVALAAGKRIAELEKA